jgi:acetyl/propionyl-CoA carboxylase alpha subunit
VRLDTGFGAGSDVPVFYDSMLAKIIVWGANRADAIARMGTTLAATRVAGVATNLPLLRAIVADPTYAAGDTTTSFLDERLAGYHLDAAVPDTAAATQVASALLAAGSAWRAGGIGIPLHFSIDNVAVHAAADRTAAGWTFSGDLAGVAGEARDVTFGADGTSGTVSVGGRSAPWRLLAPPSDAGDGAAAAAGSGTVTAPMPGKIISVNVSEGDAVEPRALLVVLEAMKMEHRIEAPLAGTVRDVRVTAGDLVTGGATLVTIGAISP